MHVMLLKEACVIVIEFLIQLLLVLEEGEKKPQKLSFAVDSVSVFTRQIYFLHYLIHFHILRFMWMSLHLRLGWLEFIL